MRFRGRTDANQKAVVKALRDVGATVFPLSAVGKGCPDLLCGYRGETHLLEVKNAAAHARRKKSEGDGLHTDDQRRFMGEWRGRPVVVVYTVDEALRAIGARTKQ